jgi:hypothetical protein
MNSRIVRSFFFVAAALVILSGCAGAALVMDGVRSVGMTETDRRSLIQERIQLFSHALYWGKTEALDALALPSAQPAIQGLLARREEGEKIVETKFISVTHDETSHQATVILLLKSYHPTFSIVQEKKLKTIWSFTASDGWQIKELLS